MLKFTKKKVDIEGVETGDFYGFDASILYEELKPLNARCDTAEVEITVYPIDDTIELDKEAITAVVIAHGSQEQCDYRMANPFIPPDPLADLITTLINNGTLVIARLPTSITSMASVQATIKTKLTKV